MRRRDKFLHDRMGDEASGSEASSKGTNLDSGASRVSVDNLVCERDTHCVEIYMPHNCADIASVVSSLFYTDLFDFTHGWIYVFGFGVAGGARRQDLNNAADIATRGAM
jgi:hypothetical protein